MLERDARGMTGARIGLAPGQFESLFPFHVACDRELQVIQVGHALARICPGLQEGSRLGDTLEIVRPAIPLDWDSIRSNAAVLFVLRSRTGSLRLRTQLLVTDDPPRLVFLASPWVQDAAELEALGLSLSDFALHDATPDMLQLVQATTVALKDTRALADRLADQRARLRETNAALAASEERFRLLATRTSDLVIENDLQRRIAYVSPSVEALLGYRPEEVLGRSTEEFVHPDDQLRLAEYRRAAISGGAGKAEVRVRRSDGSWLWAEVVGTPILDAQGQPAGIHSTARDISWRRAAAEALRRSEEKFRALSEQSPLGVMTLDLGGRVTFVNNRLVTALGGRPEDVLDEAWRQLFPGELASATLQALGARRPGDEPLNVELPLIRPDGTSGWVSITATVSIDEDGHPNGYLCVTEDITARRESEIAVAETKRRELAVAAQVQETLLHGHAPVGFPGLAIGEWIEPGQGVNGDFYEFFIQSDTIVDVLLGDAMGKGLPAALQGAATKARFSRAIARLIYENGGAIPDPAAIVARVQRTIGPQFIAIDTFTTLMYVRFDLVGRTVTWVGCGHPAILHRPVGGPFRELPGGDSPLGFSAGQTFTARSAPFAPGDLFVLYSDGLTETASPAGAPFGVAGITATLMAHEHEPPSVKAQALRREIDRFAGPAGPRDDVSCLVIEVDQPVSGSECVARTFAVDQAAPAEARAFCSHFLRSIATDGVPAQWGDALLIAIQEVTTNILRHGLDGGTSAPGFNLAIGNTRGGVQVEFTYDGPPFRPPTEPGMPALEDYPEHGFGLALIAAGTDRAAYGTTAQGRQTVTLTKYFPGHSG